MIQLQDHLDQSKIGTYGSTGDMFGASAALFSGLGFFAVALVLWSDSAERRRDLTDRAQSRTPFLVPTIGGKGARVTRAVNDADHAEVSLILELPINNVTDEPAMNIVLAGTGSDGIDLPAGNAKLDDTPFGTGDAASRTGTIHFACSGPSAKEFLVRLRSGQATTIKVALEYDSINGTRWASEVKFTVTSASSDHDQFQRILDGDSASFIQGGSALGGGGDAVQLTYEVVPNSWKHDPKK